MSLSYNALLNRSWDSIKDQLPLVAGLTLVYFVGLGALNMIPFAGGFLTGPFTAGYMICLLKLRRREQIDYQDVFWGFLNLNRLLQLVVAGLLVGFLMILGFLLLIVPGIWFAVASTFTTAYIVLREDDAVTAMKKSLEAVKGRWWNVFGLLLIVALLMGAGALCFLIGLLVTTPLATLMVLLAAEELAPRPEQLGAGTSTSSTTGPSVMTVNPS